MKREFLAIMSLFLALNAGALQQTASFTTELPPAIPLVDSATNRVFSINTREARGGGVSSLAIIHADGRMETRALDSAIANAAISSTHRKLVMVTGSWTPPQRVIVMDIDTFAVSVATAVGPKPAGIAISEATGQAYVIGSVDLPGMPWEYPGQMTGTLAEIDLNSAQSSVYSLPSMSPGDFAISPDGGRVYIVGNNYMRTGETQPAFMNVFDTRTKSLVQSAVRIGEGVGRVGVSGRDVYVLTGVPRIPGEYPQMNGSRSEIWVLDAETLAVKRSIALPDMRDPNPQLLNGYFNVGMSMFDPGVERFYAGMHAMYEFRFVAVDLATGTVRLTAMEEHGGAIGVSPLDGQVSITMARNGHLALFNRDGERIDSVPLDAAPTSALTGRPRITYHPVSGDAYVPIGSSLVVLRAAANPAAVVNLTDLWWNSNESGWGLFLDHQATKLFGVLFTHGADGAPTWLVMSEGKRLADGSFRGTLYRTSGPREQATANIAAVGSMQVRVGNDGGATLTYDVQGQVVTKSIERQRFSAAARSCGWNVGPAGGALDHTNFTALWFNPAEQGWGLAISQQGDTAFGVLFTYDAQNRATWAAMSNGAKRGLGSFAGELYRSKSASAEPVGLMSIDMTSANAGSVSFTVDGLQQSRAITRQVFAALTTACTQ